MSTSINEAAELFLNNISRARSEKTYLAYRNGLNQFRSLLISKGLDPEKDQLDVLTEDAISWFASHLKKYAPATERLYLTAVSNFYAYLAAENLSNPNLPRVRLLVRQRARRAGQRLPQFPRDSIEQIVKFVIHTPVPTSDNFNNSLLEYRNRAFILTLADTGLRVHEACSLRRGDMDWNEGRALIIGKGDQESVVRFSARSIRLLRNYLSARSELDGLSGRPLPSLAMFARHDRGAGKKILPITTTTGRKIIKNIVQKVLGAEHVGTITPHSFRHYFVTTVLRASGGNIKLAQELARHKNIQVTQRYAHLSNDELDRGYSEIFNEEK